VYVGAKQTRFALHPSSALAKKPPAWVMAFELVETSQLFARTAAKLDPERRQALITEFNDAYYDARTGFPRCSGEAAKRANTLFDEAQRLASSTEKPGGTAMMRSPG